MRALYREHPGGDWLEVDVLADLGGGKVSLREVGPELPGVFIGEFAKVRIPVISWRGLELVGLPSKDEPICP